MLGPTPMRRGLLPDDMRVRVPLGGRVVCRSARGAACEVPVHAVRGGRRAPVGGRRGREGLGGRRGLRRRVRGAGGVARGDRRGLLLSGCREALRGVAGARAPLGADGEMSGLADAVVGALADAGVAGARAVAVGSIACAEPVVVLVGEYARGERMHGASRGLRVARRPGRRRTSCARPRRCRG